MEETKYRLRDVIGSLDHEELHRMSKDLEAGGHHLRKFVKEKMKEKEKEHEHYCAVCSSKIEPYSTSTFTIIFGPDDFKKKATFCAMDCLKYFLQNLEQIKKESAHKVAKP
ncbi:MAG: hypothetical protein KJ574_00080 [Nanoarchaeota archaeon]|nr:hypothetical protein [Nanoarchaeota archaeon]